MTNRHRDASPRTAPVVGDTDTGADTDADTDADTEPDGRARRPAVRPKVNTPVPEIAWPTIALAAAVLGTWVVVGAAWTGGRLPTAATLPILVVLAYLIFTPLHDAAHRSISRAGAPGPDWNRIVGVAAGTALLVPAPVFRAIHLRHHAATNVPGKDPDYWARGRNPVLVAARCATITAKYIVTAVRYALDSNPATARAGRIGVAGLAVEATVAVLLAAWVGWWPVLVLWVLPAVLAHMFLALVFDWLPHTPHEVVGRWRDTKALEAGPVLDRVLDTVLLQQNLHVVHHVEPHLPFYRYRDSWRANRDEYLERGTPVWPRSRGRTPDAARAAPPGRP